MDISYVTYRHKDRITVSVAEYVGGSIDSAARWGSSGVAEFAVVKADEAAKALGRLVQLLAERRQLSASEVAAIAGTTGEDPQFAETPSP